MYKIFDPKDGRILFYSELKIEDEVIIETIIDEHGNKTRIKRIASCEEVTENG